MKIYTITRSIAVVALLGLGAYGQAKLSPPPACAAVEASLARPTGASHPRHASTVKTSHAPVIEAKQSRDQIGDKIAELSKSHDMAGWDGVTMTRRQLDSGIEKIKP